MSVCDCLSFRRTLYLEMRVAESRLVSFLSLLCRFHCVELS